MRKTIPLYWGPQDGTERTLIGTTEVDEETGDCVSSITDERYVEKVGSPLLYASIGYMLPPGYKLAPDAKITVHGE